MFGGHSTGFTPLLAWARCRKQTSFGVSATTLIPQMNQKVVSSLPAIWSVQSAVLVWFLLWLLTVGKVSALPGSVVGWGGGLARTPALNNITAISTSIDHSLALSSNGSVAAWGYDFDGQCDVPPGLSHVTGIAAGAFFSVALNTNGSVAAWGDNDFGQTQVPADATNIMAVSAGLAHVLALKADGSVEAWGSDDYGQSDVPAGLNGVTAVLAAWNYSLALRSDGTVRAWGVDDAGQTEVPSGLNNVVALAGNMEYCLALKSDGTVVAWGKAPQPPAGLSGVKAIAAGEDHCLALLSDGTLATWGANDSGQINVPAGLSGIVGLGAGWNYSVAVAGGTQPPAPLSVAGAALSASGSFNVSVLSQANKSYVLQYKNSLSDPNWTALPAVAGTGQTILLKDPAASAANRFYRVQEL